MKVLDYDGLDHSLAKLKAYLDAIRARDLADADDLCYVDPDEGVSVTIDDPGVTGTVLWGAESANQVALSVNGVSKLLLKAASIAGIESSISTLFGFFINGSARNALSLGGYNAAYFASASGLTALQEVVAGKQDTINDLATIRTNAGHGQTAYGWGNHASAGYATQTYVNTALADYVDCITLDGVTYLPQNGEIALPDYPTTLPASDVYAWAKAATKPSYTFSEIGSKPTTLAGYGITDAYISNGTIVIGSNSITPLTSHQSLSGYAHQIVVNGDAFEAVNSVIELPDYPTTLPASDVYAWAKAATKPTYTATEVGLGNVTNDAQVKRTEMGAASGVATLGTDGKIPASQLPSYVDDVLEYASLSAFPATGESGKIYVALDTNKTYRWSGTTYTEISPSIVIGTTTGTAFDGGSGYAHVTDGDIHVTAALKTAWSAKYDLPSGGIPSTDLASAIQTSLGHGDTAYGWGNHALAGYFPATSFTKANIKTVLEISDWALASTKPSYNFSEIGSKPTTLLGYGITDAYFGARTQDVDRVPLTIGLTTENVLVAHQSLSGYVNSISPSAETDVYLCPSCDYFYDPEVGDPYGGIVAGTAFDDLPSDWVCPICGASKANFTAGGRQFVSAVSKSSGSSTIAFTLNRLALQDLSGANNLKAIEYASGSGLLKKNADGTWGFDTNSYLTGITSAMVTGALGYTPFNAANFTQATIKSTLGISDWALAATKPGYAFSELSSKPTTIAGYGITDAASTSDLLNYLPLSGGKMTGDILFDAGHPMFSFLDGEVAIGSIFFDSTYGLMFSPAADVEYKYLHTGNTDNITTLGTITTGTWQGSPIAANKLAIDFDWVFVANAGTYDTDDYIHVN
jgi:rubredoxin